MLKKEIRHFLASKSIWAKTPEYIFLHIPKTAGSAVKAGIANANACGRFCAKPHSIAFDDLSRAERCAQTFVTVRRPVEWYLSLYNYKMHGGGGKGYDTMPDNSLDDWIADVVLCRNGIEGVMKWNRPREYKKHIFRMLEPYFETGANQNMGFLTLNFLYYTTRIYRDILSELDPISTLERSATDLIEVRHVLRQEALSDDFSRMVGSANTGIDLNPKVNAMPRNRYSKHLDENTVAQIEHRDRFILSSFYAK